MTIPELLTAMSILAIVITGILVLFVGGLNATTGMNARFQEQQDARLALTSMRNDIRFACSATVGAVPGTPVRPTGSMVTLGCVNAVAANTVTWCADSANALQPFGLYRQVGTSCTAGTGVKRASSLNTNLVFSNPICTAGTRPQLSVSLPVNATIGTGAQTYKLSDTITERNAAVC
jgi:type II secretory pathway pseudopilin PulG